MKVLIACEQFGKVREAFRKKGHEAISCDIEPCRDNSPFHIQDDVLNHLIGWDMIIAFPPCTYLSNANHVRRFNDELERYRQNQAAAIQFVDTLYGACNIVCIENPVGILSKKWRNPTQIIEPYQFGHCYKKRTCLWLKGLPLLEGTKYMGYHQPSWHAGSKNNIFRSETFQGIATAMAEQWG